MKISISDDRPPLVPIVAAGFVAGVVGVLAAALLGVAGMGPSNLRTLLGIGGGLLVGLLVKDRLVAVYEARWGGSATDGGEPTGARTAVADGEPPRVGAGEAGGGSVDDGGAEGPGSSP